MSGGDELMGVGLDAHGHADLDALALAEALGDVGDADDLLEGVENDAPDPDVDGPPNLLFRLVVAVEGDALGGHSGGEGGGELGAGADVEVEPFFVKPPNDGTREESLPGIENIRILTESIGPGAAAGAEVGFVEEIGGGAELLGERGDIESGDGGDSVAVPSDGLRPDLRIKEVEVGGRGRVVPFGKDVGVTGPGGVCGTAHAVSQLSQVFGYANAEQGQATGQHRPDGFGEREPGTVGGQGFLVLERQHTVLKVEQRIAQSFELPGEPVGGGEAGGAEEGVGVVGEETVEVPCAGGGGGEVARGAIRGAVSGSRGAGVAGGAFRDSQVARGAGEAQVVGVAGEGAGAGVRVPHAEVRVAVALDEELGGGGGPVVGGSAEIGPAGGVGADPREVGGQHVDPLAPVRGDLGGGAL